MASKANKISVSYGEKSFEKRAPKKAVTQILSRAMKELSVEGRFVSVVFVSDEEIAAMNAEYRGIEGPTDVLSFAQCDAAFPGAPEEASRSLGDIVISLDAKDRNADFFGVDRDEETARLLVHGLLHLLGWNHESNEATEPQLIKQEEVLVSIDALK